MTPTTEQTDAQIALVQATVVGFAVEALISTHPDPESVRRVFDQLFGQFQAGIASTGAATPAISAMARQCAEKLFSSPSST